MGKRIIPQARGKGGPRYRSPSHRFMGKVEYLPYGSFTAKVVDVVHDPGRSAPVMIIKSDKKKVLHIAPEGISAGDFIQYGNEIKVGNVLEVGKVPVGTRISGIEIQPGSGPKMCRSSGTFATVIGATGNRILIEFSRGFQKSMDP